MTTEDGDKMLDRYTKRRVIALELANGYYENVVKTPVGADQIVATAEKFHSFLTGMVTDRVADSVTEGLASG